MVERLQRLLGWREAGLLFVVAACTGAAPSVAPSATPAPTVEFLGNSTQLPPFVAQTEGLYEGVSVNVTKVGFGEQSALFATGNYPITSMAPWEVAQANNQGDDLRLISTAGAVYAYNPVIIRRSDEATYTTFTGQVARLTQPNQIACVGQDGNVTYSSGSTILGFSVATGEPPGTFTPPPGPPPVVVSPIVPGGSIGVPGLLRAR